MSISTTNSINSSTSQACAACKYQRRKCNADCILAPYFPADHPRQFLNAHRLFGVSNILKIIRGLDPHRRSEAMRSIIIQSNARAADPVGGCHRIILDLQRQIDHFLAELRAVQQQIAIEQQQQAILLADGTADNVGYAADHYGNFAPNVQLQTHPQQQEQYGGYYYLDGGGGGDGDNNNYSNSGSLNMTENGQNHGMDLVVPDSMLAMQQNDDVKPLVDMFQDVAAALDSSSKAEQIEEPNTTEFVEEHDLKGAASLFTLTNYTTSSI